MLRPPKQSRSYLRRITHSTSEILRQAQDDPAFFDGPLRGLNLQIAEIQLLSSNGRRPRRVFYSSPSSAW